MTIKSDGKVGIGTSSIDQLLHVQSDSTYAYVAIEGAASSDSGINLKKNGSNEWFIFNDDSNSDALQIEGDGGANDQFVTITQAGRVGVGTTAPSSKLQVAADAGNSNNVEIRLQPTNSTGGFNPDSIITAEADGTYGAHLFFTTRNTAGVRSERLRITSDGKLGLGTSSPPAILSTKPSASTTTSSTDFSGDGLFIDCVNTTNATDAYGTAISWSRSGLTTPYRLAAISNVQTASDPDIQGLAFLVHNSNNNNNPLIEGMRITGAGNVGIGTTAPGTTLTVQQSGSGAIAQFRDASNYDGQLLINTDGTFTVNGRNNVRFSRTGSDTESARIDSSGRLLVGTSLSAVSFADWRLQVLGQSLTGTFLGANAVSYRQVFVKSRSSAVGTYTIVSNGDSLGGIDFKADDGTDYLSTAASITAEVDGTPGANDMPGRLVFSTTPDSGSSPVERLRITSAGGIKFNTTSDTIDSSNFGTIIGSNSVGNPDPGLFRTARNQSGVQVVIQALGNAGQFRTMGDGDAENTNNSYGGISDAKLKENIVDANSQWNDLKALQVRNYNFKTETGYSTHTQIGLVAQEVELVSPGLVGESIDEETGESTKSVNYSVLYMKAVKALQEAMERIETLEQRLTDAGIA